jgi:pyruvate kinase
VRSGINSGDLRDPNCFDAFVKTGIPTRAEITDEAMAERAECVMLNKGPQVVRAAEVVDDVLPLMGAHQWKEREVSRRLPSVV